MGCYEFIRETSINDEELAKERIWRIGGDTGWYYGNWMWRLRGFLDKLIGGVGLRRGRTLPDKINTGLFRNIPIPNWTLRYSGFMKLGFFKRNFSSFVISHGYKSSYTVSSFTNNLQYDSANAFSNSNSAGNYEPQLLVSAATLVDEFSPLIKLDMKMRNSFSLRGEVKSDRTLTMNFNNSSLKFV